MAELFFFPPPFFLNKTSLVFLFSGLMGTSAASNHTQRTGDILYLQPLITNHITRDLFLVFFRPGLCHEWLQFNKYGQKVRDQQILSNILANARATHVREEQSLSLNSELRPEPATRQQNHSTVITYQSPFRANRGKRNMKGASCTAD